MHVPSSPSSSPTDQQHLFPISKSENLFSFSCAALLKLIDGFHVGKLMIVPFLSSWWHIKILKDNHNTEHERENLPLWKHELGLTNCRFHYIYLLTKIKILDWCFDIIRLLRIPREACFWMRCYTNDENFAGKLKLRLTCILISIIK